MQCLRIFSGFRYYSKKRRKDSYYKLISKKKEQMDFYFKMISKKSSCIKKRKDRDFATN